ncbi:MAG: orotate phosphoribosyltransferase [Acidimicrobiia bacterium]|nr:orotate phosphoribosyltransferase [Acidimicrobiia bacterium]
MTNRDELARRVWETSHLTGSFRLRSGAESHEYFDKYRFEADPRLLRDICTAILPLVPAATEVLAGLELGGVPIATVLGQATGLPVAFVRKAAKSYGTCRVAEGCDVAGRRVLIVEDVVTSGGQVAKSTADLRRLGATVQDAICVVERDTAAREHLATAGIQLIASFTGAELARASGAPTA